MLGLKVRGRQGEHPKLTKRNDTTNNNSAIRHEAAAKILGPKDDTNDRRPLPIGQVFGRMPYHPAYIHSSTACLECISTCVIRQSAVLREGGSDFSRPHTHRHDTHLAELHVSILAFDTRP